MKRLLFNPAKISAYFEPLVTLVLADVNVCAKVSCLLPILLTVARARLISQSGSMV
ncbi:MAG: hypothetical protein HRU24_00380 [Gammaproteobacteria bacterium]|nr:hypothetical protein [Gammaproteobacteria bacterium]